MVDIFYYYLHVPSSSRVNCRNACYYCIHTVGGHVVTPRGTLMVEGRLSCCHSASGDTTCLASVTRSAPYQ